jgi:hypothetical protein
MKEYVTVSFVAGGVDLSLWVRPLSYAYSTTSFSTFPTAGSIQIIALGNIYDYVEFNKLSTTFTPSFHAQSAE